jgi:hypothetical protein
MPIMKNIFTFFLCVSLILFSAINVQAQDWIITESDNSVTYIANGWIKSIESEEQLTTTMFNIDQDIIIMISDADEQYAKGSGDEFCSAMKAMRDQMYSNLPPEQANMMKDMINQQKNQPRPTVTVSAENGGVISGFQTKKYSIKVDGELFEEKWITTDPSLNDLKEAYKHISKLTLKMASCSVPDESFLRTSPEFSDEYQQVELSGVEVKSVSYEYGAPEENTSIVSFEKSNIDASEFEVPDGYMEISFGELMMSMSDM